MATEAGETIAPLAEEGSGSGEVTPGTTETGTPGGSGEGSTVIPSGTPSEPTTPSAPPAAEKKYLNVKVVLGEGAGTIGEVGLGEMQLTFSNSTSLKVGEIGAVTSTNIEYIAEQTYGVTAISSENYDVTVSGSSLQETVANPTLVVTIGKLTPKVTGKIDGPENFCANTVAEYNLTGVWGNAVTKWELAENHADANVVKSNAGNVTVEAHTGNQTFVLKAFCGTHELALKKITVNKNQTELIVITSKNMSGEPARPWKTPLDVTITLKNKTDDKGIAGKTIAYKIGNQSRTGVTNEDGQIIEKNIQLNKHYITPISVTAKFAGDDAYTESTGNDSYPVSKQSGKLTFNKEYIKKNPLVLTYGTEDITENIMLKDDKGNELTGDDVSVKSINASSDPTNFVSVANTSTVDKTITFHAQNASTNPVKVKVTAETENYIFEKTIYVKVKPYELTLDTSIVSTAGTGEGRTYDNTKIYDATTNVNVKAAFRGGNDLTENIAKEVENNFTDVIFENYDSKIKEVKGEEESQTFDFEPKNFANTSLKNKTDITKNYVIKSGEKAKPEVKIQKRTLNLTVANSERPYRSLGYTKSLDKLVSVDASNGDTGFAGTDAVNNLEGFTYPTVVDATAEGLTTENVKKNDAATCSVHTSVLKLVDGSGNPTNNYKFDFNSYKHGDLIVTKENITNATDYVTINNNTSTHAYENENHDRYYGKDAVIKFALEGGYNKIYLRKGTDLTTDGLKEAEAYEAGTATEEEIYLAKVNND